MHLLRSPYKYIVIIIAAFIIELLLLTKFIRVLGPYISPVVFFASSLIIGFVGIRMSLPIQSRDYGNPTRLYALGDGKHRISTSASKWFQVAILIICIGVSSILFFKLVNEHPIDVTKSDIIPQTQVLVERFLHHEFPYTIISNWGYNLFPTYQPLQWLPYTIAEYINMDYRVFAFSILMLVIVVYFKKYKNKLAPAKLSILIIVSFLPVIFICLFQPSVYYNSLENLVVVYYLLMAYAILTDSVVFTGVGLVLCLLSRYSVILWLPLFLFIILLNKPWKQTFLVLVICILGFILFYFIPFLSKDSDIFMKGYHYHTTAAIAEWKGQNWQQPGDKPFQLFRGLGFAGRFYDHSTGTIEQKLNKYRILHLVLSSITVLLLGSWYYLKRRLVDWRIFSLASLKIYLAVFYSFIQIPYDYLYLTLLYLSIPLLIVSLLFSTGLIINSCKYKTA